MPGIKRNSKATTVIYNINIIRCGVLAQETTNIVYMLQLLCLVYNMYNDFMGMKHFK